MKKFLLFLFIFVQFFNMLPVVIKTGSYNDCVFTPDGGSVALSEDDLERLNSKMLNDVVSSIEDGMLSDDSDASIPVGVGVEELRVLRFLSQGEYSLESFDVNQLPSLLKAADYLIIQNEDVLQFLVRKFLREIKNISWDRFGEHLVALGNFFENNVCSQLLQSAICGHVRPIEMQNFRDDAGDINSVRWAADGAKVLIGSSDGRARIWDVTTGNCLKILSGHTERVRSVHWSPDGTKVVTASDDNTARIWDAATGNCLKILSGHPNYVNSVYWSPDGTKVLTGSHDRTAKIWDVVMGGLLADIIWPYRSGTFSTMVTRWN